MATENAQTGTVETKKTGLSIAAKLAQIAILKFFFVDIRADKAQDGTMIAILTLDKAIEEVTGSQTYTENGQTRPFKAYDVEEIRVHEDAFNDDFIFDEDGTTGKYEGKDLLLDVAKNGSVWLVDEKFSQAGNRMRREGRNNRVQEVIERQKQREAAAGARPTDNLTPVDTTK